MKQIDKFIKFISELEPVEFAGLARVLKVRLLDEVNPEAELVKDRFAARSFTDVLTDILAAFEKSDRKRRREILKLIKDCVKEKVDAGNS